MPTYEYACRQCGEHLEVVQSFHDDALSVCHNCGGELKKVFGNIGIVFKGSGFYKTDSRSSSSASKSSASDSGSGSASKGDGAKGDGAKETVKSESKPDSSASAPSSSAPAPASSTKAAAAS
ncbi:MAG: FmdB family zinc ribbon protein [Acidimicrobiales bacterium]|jgi:putative FmdB family regulatory protein